MDSQDVGLIATYRFWGSNSGIGVRNVREENLEKCGDRENTEEKSKPARFKNRSMRHPHFARGVRARHKSSHSDPGAKERRGAAGATGLGPRVIDAYWDYD
jgi:hypothetical protein